MNDKIDDPNNIDDKDDIEKQREVETFDAILKEMNVYATGENIKILQEKGYYGEYNGEYLKLGPIEALLLLEKLLQRTVIAKFYL